MKVYIGILPLESGWDDDWDDEPAPARSTSSARTAKAAQKRMVVE